MKKDHAIALLGGTAKKAAEAMGYRAVQTIYLWPDELPQATADRVMGAAARISKSVDEGEAMFSNQEVAHG